MPYIEVTTNVDASPETARSWSEMLSALASELLSKPESYVMACVKPGTALLFGGSADPAAHVRLDSIGLSREACPELSRKLCSFLEERLGVAPSRVYIDFRDLDRGRFGWDSKTFG
ncbi:MAG: phenylpyruvate tautomerase [Desulfovibrionales bacterium]|nr:phenylpyruvate tautomerase [Desulfovibrionales bacterium]